MVINGQWQWSSMVINGNINGLSYENSAHYKKANNIRLTVGLILHDRNPFYAKKEAISK